MSKILSMFWTFTAFEIIFKYIQLQRETNEWQRWMINKNSNNYDSVFKPVKCISSGTIFSESTSLKSLAGKSRGRRPADEVKVTSSSASAYLSHYSAMFSHPDNSIRREEVPTKRRLCFCEGSGEMSPKSPKRRKNCKNSLLRYPIRDLLNAIFLRSPILSHCFEWPQ